MHLLLGSWAGQELWIISIWFQSFDNLQSQYSDEPPWVLFLCGFFSLFYSWNSYCNLNAVGLGLKEMLAGSMLCTIFLWQQKEGEWIVWSLSSIVVQMKPELETTFEIEALSPVHNCVSPILWVPRHINYSCKEEILRNFSWGNTALPRKKLFASKDT